MAKLWNLVRQILLVEITKMKNINLKNVSKFCRVPNWLIEMLTWIERIEMANSPLSTSSWVFEQLCGPKLHGQVEPHAVGPLDLIGEQDAVSRDWRGIARYKNKLVALPSTPPPEYITGFKRIRIL